MWRRREDGKWEHVHSEGAGDLKATVAAYVKQQEVHTQSVVRQRHSVAVRQVCALFARVSDDVTSHSRYLGDIVAGFKADPSAGASKVLLHRTSVTANPGACCIMRAIVAPGPFASLLLLRLDAAQHAGRLTELRHQTDWLAVWIQAASPYHVVLR